MKGEHRPNSNRSKRRREQRKAAAKNTIEMERNKAKSAMSAAAEPDQASLERRAMTKGWSVPPEQQPSLIDAQVKIALNPKARLEVRIAAFRAIIKADQNQWDRDHPQLPWQLTLQQLTVNNQPAEQLDEPAEDDLREGLARLMKPEVEDMPQDGFGELGGTGAA